MRNDRVFRIAVLGGDGIGPEVMAPCLALLAQLQGGLADLVISDMAPNMSGVVDIDQPKAMYLVELALELARQVLKPGGTFVAKVFQGEGFDALFRDLRAGFGRVVTRKPEASRPRSRDVYLVAGGFRR